MQRRVRRLESAILKRVAGKAWRYTSTCYSRMITCALEQYENEIVMLATLTCPFCRTRMRNKSAFVRHLKKYHMSEWNDLLSRISEACPSSKETLG